MLIWGVLLIDVISGISSYLQYDLLIAIQNKETVTDQMVDSNDLREQIIAVIYMIVFYISGFTFIQWFRRAYYNLNIRKKCQYTEGWAAGAWIVPIISLYRPYQIMKEMWEGSIKNLKSRTDQFIGKESAVFIGIWWVLWIVLNYIGTYVLKVSFKAGTVQNLINASIAEMIINVLGIPLALLAISIIKSYSFKEEKLAKLEKKEGTVNV